MLRKTSLFVQELFETKKRNTVMVKRGVKTLSWECVKNHKTTAKFVQLKELRWKRAFNRYVSLCIGRS